MALIKCNNLNMKLSRIILKSSSFKFRNTLLIRFHSTDTSLNELIKEENSRVGVKPNQMFSKPPFAKNLFLGVFDKDVLIYPELLSADQLKLLLDKLEPIEQYFTNQVKSNDIEQKGKISNEIINNLKNFKFFGLQIPKKYDGEGLNATEYARYCEVIGVDSSVSLLLLAHQVLGVQSLLRYGSEEQKIKFLPKLASGDWYAAFCFSEEISGSDLAAIQTTAKESEKNGIRTWLLNGSKLWVTNASSANIFIVLALTYSKNQFGDQKHVSAFIVERHYPGIIVGKPIDMIGVKGIEMNEVSFKNVQLTENNLLGDEKGGFKMAIDILNSNRFAFGAVSLGFMKKLYKLVINHVINRKQYVIDLKDCKQIQKHCSEVALRIYALESMIYMTTGLHDCYENYDGSMENAIVKAFSMEECQKCVDTCLDLLGARGVVKEESYEKFYRDFKCLSIFDGALDFTKLYIAATGLHHATSEYEDIKKYRDPFNNPTFILKRLFSHRRQANDDPSLNLELFLQLHPSLVQSSQKLEYCVLRLKYAVTIMFSKYGPDVLNHQLELLRLSSAVIEIYAMTAVLGRASRACCTGILNADSEIYLAQKYCFDAHKRVKQLISDIVSEQDVTADFSHFKIAEDIFKHKGYFLEHPMNRNI